MSIYSLANRTSSGTTGAACMEIRTTSAIKPRLLELGISINAATASVFGLGRPAAVGITPTSPVTVLAENDADPAGTVTTALAWGTAPTVPANFFRRVSTPATIGAGVIWTFPRGLTIPVSSGFVVWNITTNSVADIWIVVDE